MEYFLPILAASTDRASEPDICMILFWAFLIVAVIWLLIWMLLRDKDSSTASGEYTATAATMHLTNTAPAGKTTESDGPPKVATATAETAAAAFRNELDSGNARQDEALGILFNSPPDEPDDLKKIKGVAKVLEGRLHDLGIYQFRQIAYWTDTATAEFAARLSFRYRIYRDNWIAQAKTLHENKYGKAP